LTQKSVIILAGSRPAGDPLAKEFGVPGKAFIPVNGQPMIGYVVRPFLQRADIASVHIVTELGLALRDHPDLGWIANDDHIQIHPKLPTIAASLRQLFKSGAVKFPALVTTGDHALINRDMIDQMFAQSEAEDVGIGLVDKKTLLAEYPDSKRTWLKLRGGQYSGANLFYLGSPKALKMIELWARVEQQRKKGWKIFTLFGPVLLFLALTRMISLKGLGKKLSRKFDVRITAITLDQAEACIDVDRAEDVALAERILKNRS